MSENSLKLLNKLLNESSKRLQLPVYNIEKMEILSEYIVYAYSIGYDDGQINERKKHANGMERPVKSIDADGNEKTYRSCRSAARKINRSNGALRHALKHNQKCAGFHWEYI